MIREQSLDSSSEYPGLVFDLGNYFHRGEISQRKLREVLPIFKHHPFAWNDIYVSEPAGVNKHNRLDVEKKLRHGFQSCVKLYGVVRVCLQLYRVVRRCTRNQEIATTIVYFSMNFFEVDATFTVSLSDTVITLSYSLDPVDVDTVNLTPCCYKLI